MSKVSKLTKRSVDHQFNRSIGQIVKQIFLYLNQSRQLIIAIDLWSLTSIKTIFIALTSLQLSVAFWQSIKKFLQTSPWFCVHHRLDIALPGRHDICWLPSSFGHSVKAGKKKRKDENRRKKYLEDIVGNYREKKEVTDNEFRFRTKYVRVYANLYIS